MARGSAVLKYFGDLFGSGTLAERKIAGSGILCRPICKLPSGLRDLERLYHIQVLVEPVKMPLPALVQSDMVIDENWRGYCCREVHEFNMFRRFMKMLRGGNADSRERTKNPAIGENDFHAAMGTDGDDRAADFFGSGAKGASNGRMTNGEAPASKALDGAKYAFHHSGDQRAVTALQVRILKKDWFT